MGGIKLFFRYLTTGFRVQAQYRGQFVLLITTRFFVDGIHLLGLMALFTRFDSLGGWSLYEVMLFYGMTYMAMGLAESYSHGFHAMARFVRSGDFDRLMLRPRRIFLQILGGEFQFFRMGGFLNGLIPFLWGLKKLEIAWSPAEWALAGAAVLFGSLTYAGVSMIQAGVSFFTVESLEIFNVFNYGGVELSARPLDIYAGWLRDLFTYGVPLAAVNYLPLSYLLGRHYVPDWAAWLSPLMSVGFLGLAALIWRMGIRHYQSTGS